MSYNVHITKASHWAESQEQPITLEEWNAVVAADPELHAQEEATATNGSVRISVGGQGMVIWESEEGPMWFSYSRGRITSAGSEEIIEKMLEIAAKLDAKVQGDEGELY